MKLYIDTSDSGLVKIKVDGREYVSASRKNKSQKLLYLIDKTLKKKGIKFKDLSEIIVNTGPGSFTGLRVGMSVAQTLAWILQIPLNGIKPGNRKVADIDYT